MQNEDLSIADGAIAPWATMNYMQPMLEALADALQVQPRSAVEDHSGQDAQGNSQRLRRRGDRVRLRARRASPRLREAVRRRAGLARSALQGDRVREHPRAARSLYEHAAMSGMQRRAAQERKPVRPLQRQIDQRSHRDVDQAGVGFFRASEADRAGDRNRPADPQRNSRAAGLSRRRRAGLPHARSHRRQSFGRRRPTYSARDANRFEPGRRALHP